MLFHNAKGINHFSEDIIAYGSTITFEVAFIKENSTTIGVLKIALPSVKIKHFWSVKNSTPEC